MNNITITFSDKEMTKIKIVDLDQFYNFVVDDFFKWNHLVFQIVVWICHLLKFKIWIIQTESHEKMTKIKVVDLDELYNFRVHDFFHLKSFLVSKSCLKFLFFEIQILNYLNKVTWKVFQNKICRYWWVLQLWCLQHFHFRSFTVLKFYSKIWNWNY
jgi:hypothetical protein